MQDFFHQPYVVNVFAAVLLPFTLGQYPSERFYDGDLRTAPSVVRLKMGREHESIMWDLKKTTRLPFLGDKFLDLMFGSTCSTTSHPIPIMKYSISMGLLQTSCVTLVARKRNISKSLVLYWALLETLEVKSLLKTNAWNLKLTLGQRTRETHGTRSLTSV